MKYEKLVVKVSDMSNDDFKNLINHGFSVIISGEFDSASLEYGDSNLIIEFNKMLEGNKQHVA